VVQLQKIKQIIHGFQHTMPLNQERDTKQILEAPELQDFQNSLRPLNHDISFNEKMAASS
jgi:hypothetical protein